MSEVGRGELVLEFLRASSGHLVCVLVCFLSNIEYKGAPTDFGSSGLFVLALGVRRKWPYTLARSRCGCVVG